MQGCPPENTLIFSKGIALLGNPKENTQKWSKKEKSVLTAH